MLTGGEELHTASFFAALTDSSPEHALGLELRYQVFRILSENPRVGGPVWCLLVPAWIGSDCFRSRRGFQPHNLDVPIAGTSGDFEPLLIEDPDDAASVAYQLPAL